MACLGYKCVYTPAAGGGGGELIEQKYYEDGHCLSVLRPRRFFYIHPLCQRDGTAIKSGHASHGRIHYHVRGGGISPPPPDTLQAFPQQGPSRLALEGPTQLTQDELRLFTF